MTTLIDNRWENWPRASAVRVDPEAVHVRLVDGREIAVPIDWFGFLADGTEVQRQDFAIEGDGQGIWWDSLDDGVSVPSLLGLPEDPPPDPAVRSYAIDYTLEDGIWAGRIRGTRLMSVGSTLAATKRAARSNLRQYLGVRALGASGIAVVDEVRSQVPVAAS